MTRYCTLPNIPWFRSWFEGKFGDLCKRHDEAYGDIAKLDPAHRRPTKIHADYRFCATMACRGHPCLAICALIAFQFVKTP